MSGTVARIPPPLGTNTGSPTSPNRTDPIPVDITNNTTITNVAQNVVNEDLPLLLDSRGDRLEPYLIKILENGPFVPMSPLSTFTNQLSKPQKQWSPEDRKLANQDKRLQSIIISCLPNDIMKSVIKCTTAKAMWNDLVLAHEGPSETKDTKIDALRLKFNALKALEGEKVNGTFTRMKCLLNDLENNGVSIPQAELNVTFVNNLPRKWLSMNQTQRAKNSIKNDTLAALYGKYNYEEGLIDQIYDNSDVEEDTRSSSEFLANLYAEFHNRALLANQKRYYKRSGRAGSTKKPIDKTKETYFACGKLVSFKDKGVTKVKAFMAIAEEEPSIGKNDVRSGQWVEITMKKVQILLSMTDGDERKHVLDYTHVDLHYVEDQRKNLLSKFNSLNQELSSCKSELVDLKNTKALNCSLQNEIARLNLENESHRDEISDLKKVSEKWTSSKVTLDQLLTKKVHGNIVRTLGGRGKKKDIISSKKVLFSKAAESSFETIPKITSDSESECGNLEPLPPLPINPLTMSPSAHDPIPVKKTDSSTEKLILTLMEEYRGFNDHHSDDCEYYPGCDICGSIAHEIADCTKKPTLTKRKPRIASQRSNEPTEKLNDMSSYNEESNACFFSKASNSVNWLWHKRLSHLNFKNINKLVKQNLVAGLPSLTFSKDKICSACEKGKHHRASFKTKRSFSINKCLHLLHMDLFGPIKPQSISHNKYTLVILDEYSRRQEIKETYHITFGEDDEAISQSSTEGDAINFNENRSFPDDEFPEPWRKITKGSCNNKHLPYISAYDPLSSNNINIP
ncbi:retrovirus-related pol polyprotein from transposon TNT 1-94 [Tanacetum coccineum]